MSACSQSQPTIQQSLHQLNPYSNGSKRQMAITKKLAVFVGSTNVPLSLVDNLEFRDLLFEMDKRYSVPHRKKISQEIEQIYQTMKQRISLTLEHAKKINLCGDIWTKPGMTASFLGLTAHFFTHNDKKAHNITLAVRRFPSPHTGKRKADLLDLIVNEWKIPREKIFRVLSDNGSNMISAFKVKPWLEQEDDELESNDDLSEDESDNEESETLVAKEISEFEEHA